MKTLKPIHWSDRVRQILYILLGVAALEYSTPVPFIQSAWGLPAWGLLTFFVGKAFWRLRQERSPRFYKKTQKLYETIQLRSFKITDFTRYRLQRLGKLLVALYVLGFILDTTAESCEGAIACALNLPALIANNFGDLLFFAIRLAMSFIGIFGMMWLMARMDLFTEIMPDAISTRFSDVYGQDKAVESMKELIGILNKPDEVEARGGYMPGGILLEGPPGTGKTLLAEAAAGETGMPFISTGPESFTNMFVGVPVLKVKMLFRKLRKASVKYGGVVCFMDEIDALGSRGMGVVNQFVSRLVYGADNMVITGGGAAGSGALQMMLTEMSGMSKPKGMYNRLRVFLGFKPLPPPKYRILWIGATNMKEKLDAALLRPGRFDRHVKVGYPDLKGRMATFKGYLDRVDSSLEKSEIERLSRTNPRATGASIKDAVNEGLLKVIREGRETITYEDLVEAMRAKEFGVAEGRAETEDDRKRVSLHEAAHAVASYHYRPEAPIQFASVEKRGGTGGMVYAQDEADIYTLRSRLIADIKVSLASVWSEKFYFDDNISTGPSSDLKKASTNALAMFGQLGMGSTVMVYPSLDSMPEDLIREAEDWLNQVYADLAEEMYAVRDEVELVAQLLEKEGTVDGYLIHELLDKMQ